MTLFDPSPKSSVKDLYGRDKELPELVRDINEKRWVVLLGPRRIGKTSLARCALTKTKIRKNVVLDAREESDFSKGLFNSLTRQRRISRFKVSGGIGPASVAVDVARDRTLEASIGNLLDSAGNMVILIDEAQWLRNPRRVSSLLAHIYDYHYDKVTTIITGSAVGVMKSIIDPSSKSPLYGRAITIREVQRWSPSESLGFLMKGCSELKKRYDERGLSSVVERLDGIPGWLTLFGYNFASKERAASSEAALKETVREASRIVKDELENTSKLSLGWKRQISILREIAHAPKRFSEIGADLKINNTALSHNLEMLHRLGYISKNEEGEYQMIDPMVADFLS